MPLVGSLHLGFESLWPLFLLPVALFLAWLGYRRTTPPLAGRERLVFVGLRTLSFLLLLIVLASPVLDRLRNEPRPPRIALLVDESASMSTEDGGTQGTPMPRIDQARDVVRAMASALDEEGLLLEVVPFAAEAGAAQRPASYAETERPAAGGLTDILGALRSTADRLAGENLQALVLMTDGRATKGGLDPSALAGIGRPVFVVGMGDTLRAADLAIDRCEYAPIAYVESEAVLQVRVENSGFRGRSVPLRLLEGERELFRRDLRFEQDHGRTEVEIPLQLTEPGRKSLRLVLEPQEGELSDRNNRREIRIEVLKNRLRVLFLAARPDWDVASLARLLRDDPSVALTLVHADVGGGWIQSDTGSRFELPRGETALYDQDLFILGAPGPDMDSGFLGHILAAVDRGRGLLLLAGRESAYTVPNVFETLAPALPVQRSERQPLRYVVQKARLTPQGRLHPVTSPLADLAEPAGLLSSLAPLLGWHAEVHAKPGALSLLVTDAAESEPILAVGRYGAGHTAAWTVFPIWRWGFTENEAARSRMSEVVSHLVRWLTQPRDVDRVQVTTGKPVYQGGEAVDFVGQVLDAQLQPLPDAEVRLEIRRVGEDRETSATWLMERRAGKPGEYHASQQGLPAGEYAAEAIAITSGVEVGRDTTAFTVETYSVEFANTSQDVGFLRELAERTGGRYTSPADAADLARQLPRSPQPVILHSEIEVWNSAWLFVAFIVFLAAEWLLRKRRGML